MQVCRHTGEYTALADGFVLTEGSKHCFNDRRDEMVERNKII